MLNFTQIKEKFQEKFQNKLKLVGVDGGSKYNKDFVILIFSILFGILIFYGLSSWSKSMLDKSEPVKVVVALNNIEPFKKISSEDVEIILIPKNAVPNNAISIEENLNNLSLIRPVAAREILNANHFSSKKDGAEDITGLKIPNGFKGLLIPSSWLYGPIPKLKIKDTVTFLIINPTVSDFDKASFPIENISILEVNGSESIFVLVPLDVASTLSSAHAFGAKIGILVDSGQ
ncbi:MAG: SAF domain-containing protein [Patescibacteria group bacterium]